jgi:thiol-disulfide isomerase/thioredoxin
MQSRTLFSLCLVLLAGCEAGGLSSEWKPIEPLLAAPDFTLSRLEGGEASLAEYRGHAVLMEFWATWCGPCRYSTPSLEVIYRKYRDRGVAVLLINQQETPEAIREWAENRFTATILLDRDGTVARRYGLTGVPQLFIVDQGGRLLYRRAGYRGGLERDLKHILDGLLNGDTAPHTG